MNLKYRPAATLLTAWMSLTAILGCGGGSSESIFDAPGGSERDMLLTQILESHGPAVAVPAYERLETQAEALEQATGAYCGARSATRLTALEAAWRNTMAAWSRASVITIGPILDDNRNLRLQFWPDSNGNVPRSVEQLLARDTVLSATVLAQQPVPAQGLSAFEYVVFDPDARARLTAPDTGARSCQLLEAIATNIRDIAGATSTEWKNGFSRTLATAGAGNETFGSPREGVDALVNGLILVSQTVQVRLLDPLPAATGGPRPTRAESFRSRTSLDNVKNVLDELLIVYRANLGGAFGFDDFLGDSDQFALHDRIAGRFLAPLQNARDLGMPLEDAIETAEGREAIEGILDEIVLLHRILEDDLTEAMGSVVRFNGLDGD